MIAQRNHYSARPTQLWLTVAGIILVTGSSMLMLLSELPRTTLPTPRVSAALPLSFEPNAGQTDPSAQFIAHAAGSTLYFKESGLVLALQDQTQGSANHRPVSAARTGSDPASRPGVSTVQLEFVGASAALQVAGGALLPGKVNYIKGSDRSQWHTNLPTYGDISYANLYDGITLSYSGDSGQLKGTYTVAAGADPTLIRWRYLVPSSENRVASTSIDAAGSLVVDLPSHLKESAPVAWQESNGQKWPISVGYTIGSDGSVGFAVGEYDHSKPLIIDPTIIYSTYLGGFYDDGAGGIWLDSVGDIFVGGTTNSSDFPVAGDPFQPVYGGGDYDMFVSRLTPDGSGLIYSTFIGGNDWDQGDLIGVDANGIATLGGWTASENFPTTPGAYQTSFAGTEDVAVARLSADGSDLVFGSYWGDAGVDEPYGFAVDNAGNTYFTGYYYPGFSSWAFVSGLTADGSDQLFRHNLGGSTPGPGDQNANSSGEGIVVDGAGNIYVTGYTRAADFPVTPGAYRTSIEAFEDGFITKLSPLGQSLIYSTYIPGGVSEYPADIAIDAAGNAYITGNTSSSDYPTTTGAFETACGDPRCAFVTKLNPAGSDLVYSSFLGGPDFDFETEDYGFVVRVDNTGHAYAGGYTSATDFPVVNPIQATLEGPYDGFLTKFNPMGTGVEYSTYLGGASGDSLGGIALDEMGHVYIVGGSSSTDFPLVNPLQPTNHGQSDAFVAVIAEDGAVTRTPTATVTGTPPTPTATPNPCSGLTAWRTETPMPIPHSGSASAVLNDRLYVIGGASNSPTPVRYTQMFDPASNTWTTKAPYPDGLGLAAGPAVAVNGKIYTLADTYSPSESFMEMYDPATDNWTRKANLPEPLVGGTIAGYGGKIYVFSGQLVNEPASTHVYEYDPATDTFTSRAPMPTGQFETGAATIGNRIYVMGGYQYVHYVYDPLANSWSTTATPLTPSFSDPAVFAFNGEVWVIGGYDNWTRRGYPPDQEVQIYNPVSNQWRYGPALNQPRYHSTAAGVINGRAYLVGGVDLNSNNYPYVFLGSMESIAYAACNTPTPGTPSTATPTATRTATRPTTSTLTATPTSTPAASTSTSTSTSTPAASTPTLAPSVTNTVAATSSSTATRTPTRPTTSTSTPSATGQPGDTSTPTQQPSITSTPTICTIEFSDVPSGSTFYAFIKCMACMGIIDGYSDGTFRPSNTVTRGQLAKIVSNSAGFSHPVSGQTFADVLPGSTFYTFIERLASRGVMGGYACGGAGEPCGSGNLPYFRPGSGASRGQLTKIVSNAAGFTDPDPSTSTFTDVPVGSTFHIYAERLLLNRPGVMGGYPCGGPGEPCDQQSRAYFRPADLVTRGQTAKIVDNTFYSDCPTP